MIKSSSQLSEAAKFLQKTDLRLVAIEEVTKDVQRHGQEVKSTTHRQKQQSLAALESRPRSTSN
ncbi:hypothetical protein RvY_12617 [Ramazzottius varieornatus]|uniref:Uncharacterized protein n=1 Tax=Ramazzottius varieornatus TaxID=947166 RepID=A0A1D1VQJ9_RAMVA|nr:hypothetical protein RvY_12617 [Ramazzottius varieornatus]